MACMEHECVVCGWATFDNVARTPCPKHGFEDMRHHFDEPEHDYDREDDDDERDED